MGKNLSCLSNNVKLIIEDDEQEQEPVYGRDRINTEVYEPKDNDDANSPSDDAILTSPINDQQNTSNATNKSIIAAIKQANSSSKRSIGGTNDTKDTIDSKDNEINNINETNEKTHLMANNGLDSIDSIPNLNITITRLTTDLTDHTEEDRKEDDTGKKDKRMLVRQFSQRLNRMASSESIRIDEEYDGTPDVPDLFYLILLFLNVYEIYRSIPRVSRYYRDLFKNNDNFVVNLSKLCLANEFHKKDANFNDLKFLFKLQKSGCIEYWLPRIIEENKFNIDYTSKKDDTGILLNKQILGLYPIQPKDELNTNWFSKLAGSALGGAANGKAVSVILRLIGSTHDWTDKEEALRFFEWVLECDSQQKRKSIILETKLKTPKDSNQDGLQLPEESEERIALINVGFMVQLLRWPSYCSDVISDPSNNLMFDEMRALTKIDLICDVVSYFEKSSNYNDYDNVVYVIGCKQKQNKLDKEQFNKLLMKLYFEFVGLVMYPRGYEDNIVDSSYKFNTNVYLNQMVVGDSMHDELNNYGKQFKEIINSINVLVERSYNYYFPKAEFDVEYEMTQYINHFDNKRDNLRHINTAEQLKICKEMILRCLN